MMMVSIIIYIITLFFSSLHVTVLVGSVSLDDSEIACLDDATNGIVSDEVGGNTACTKHRHDIERSVRWKKINALAAILEDDQDLTDTRLIDMKDTDLFNTRLGRKRKKFNNNLFREPAALGVQRNRAIFKMLNLQFRNVLSAATIFSETVQNDISASKRKKLANALNDVALIVKTVEQASMDTSRSKDEVITVYRTRSRLLELFIEVVSEVVDIAVTAVAGIVTLVVETAQNAVDIVFGPSPTTQPQSPSFAAPTQPPKAPTQPPKAPTQPPKAPTQPPKAPTQPPKAPTQPPKALTKAPTLAPSNCTAPKGQCKSTADCCSNLCGGFNTTYAECYCNSPPKGCVENRNCCSGICIGGGGTCTNPLGLCQ